MCFRAIMLTVAALFASASPAAAQGFQDEDDLLYRDASGNLFSADFQDEDDLWLLPGPGALVLAPDGTLVMTIGGVEVATVVWLVEDDPVDPPPHCPDPNGCE